MENRRQAGPPKPPGRPDILKRLETLLWGAAIVLMVPLIAAQAARVLADGLDPVPVTQEPAIRQEMPGTGPSADAGDPQNKDLHHGAGPDAQATDQDAQARAADRQAPEQSSPVPDLLSNLALWSSQRLAALETFRQGLALAPAIGVMHLPTQDSQIPIFASVSEMSMTLGAGHLPDTPGLDSEGNIALTAHRDGAFRVLKDLEVGDPIVLQTANGERRFRVTRQRIVTPDRIDVLDPTPRTTLTLITCYPFYFVGSAPERFIVHAELEQATGMELAKLGGRNPGPESHRAHETFNAEE